MNRLLMIHGTSVEFVASINVHICTKNNSPTCTLCFEWILFYVKLEESNLFEYRYCIKKDVNQTLASKI